MSAYLHVASGAISFSIFFLITSLNASTKESASDEWDYFLEETDAFIEELDHPVSEPEKPAAAESQRLFTASLKTGPGYSSNFLKRSNPVSSNYIHLEADAWLGWFFDKSLLSGFFFIESNFYAEDLDFSDEVLGLSQISWRRSWDLFDYGVELNAIYSDQIYDASLSTIGAPVGTRIEQFLPGALIYLDWYATPLNRFRLGTATRRVEFDLEGKDYWEPMLKLEWEHLWNSAFRNLSKLDISRQTYDDDLGRDARGLVLPTPERLVIDRLALSERLTWTPPQWSGLQVNLSVGIAWEEESSGKYEALRQNWAALGTRFSSKFGKLNLSARWMETRYKYRQVSYFDTTPNLQIHRSLNAEYKLPLYKDFSLYLRGQWSELSSRIEEDSYFERRGECLLEWSY